MSRFSRLPGISDGGGYRNYLVGAVYALVIMSIIGGLGGGGGADDPATAASSQPTTTTPTGTLTATQMTTDTGTGTTTVTSNPTPTATPTPEPTPQPAPDGDSYSFSGADNSVTDGFETEGGLVVFDLGHGGESNYQVEAVPVDGGDRRYLANEIGTYDGQVAVNLPAGEWRLDVTADGDWSADVTQPRYNENDLKGLPVSGDDSQAAYFGPFDLEGTTEVTFEIEDDSQAAVWLATEEGEYVDLLHNEIGPYEGSALVNRAGVALIIVETDSADWRIEIEDGSS